MDDTQPDPVTGEDIRGLRLDTQGLTDAVSVWATKDDVAVAAKQSDRKAVARLLIAGLVLVAAFGWPTYLAHRQHDADVAKTTEARVASCQQSNAEVYAKVNALNDRDQDLLRSLAGAPVSEEARQFLADQIAQYEAIKITYRDCTPAGIAKYLKAASSTTEPPPSS